jgi:RNA polymerase sigma-70 factor, ECF subfamily
MIENEINLLKKSKNGDIEAFEELIDGYQKKVFNIAFRMVGNYDDASELAQEVFIKIFKGIKSFKEESTFSTWVYKITTNVCLDELRKTRNNKSISLDEELKLDDGEVQIQIVDHRPSPEIILEQKEIKKTVKKAIDNLSHEHRIVIILRELNGLNYGEIAKILKCPVGTVKSRINRARQELKEILKNNKELFNEEYVKINSKEESL